MELLAEARVPGGLRHSEVGPEEMLRLQSFVPSPAGKSIPLLCKVFIYMIHYACPTDIEGHHPTIKTELWPGLISIYGILYKETKDIS